MQKGLVLDYAGVLTDPGADELYGYVQGLRERGVRTALLSNAPGASAEAKRSLSPYFDALVFSGEVGVAKPHREVYLLTAGLLDLPAGRCVFVDDAAVNVRGAVEAGMAGVHHTSVETTLTELGALFPT
ncbi:HAD-IA family hydrolase [Amycolatopsis sp. H20-H5]|uniref:HAD-IA family hydrolase n=1 Tax=Amycolatopsis sp. H20-H5 TaxID=3046309 RepID=UPI002DC008B8|nr:HAD-IA family hydrolase [Amycolatopsis sp. H20-H5]MEC3980681.1 HAD-IA family hydrolase [Amycolatopsis sp. H20-H5]